MSRSLDSKVSTPATKQEKQVAAHVIGEKISLKRSCKNNELQSVGQTNYYAKLPHMFGYMYVTDQQGYLLIPGWLISVI